MVSFLNSKFFSPDFWYERGGNFLKGAHRVIFEGNLAENVLAVLAVFFITIIAYCFIRLLEIRIKEKRHLAEEIAEYARRQAENEKKQKEEGKTMFRLPYNFAPIDIMIFPLVKKNNLTKIARDIKIILEKDFVTVYDEVASIGKRYLRAAEVGTPYCITVDFDSLKKKDVTIRDRDSEKQIRVKIKDLKEVIIKLMNKEVKFEKAGKLVK